jgi:hypothetical protein
MPLNRLENQLIIGYRVKIPKHNGENNTKSKITQEINRHKQKLAKHVLLSPIPRNLCSGWTNEVVSY